MKQDAFFQTIIHHIGGEGNVARKRFDGEHLYVTVKDSGMADLEELNRLDGVSGTELNRNILSVTIQEDFLEDVTMAKNFKQLAQNIMTLAGAKENVTSVFHCMTRLRMTVKDVKKVDQKAINDLDGVLGVTYQGGQLQVIIGQKVGRIYEMMIEQYPMTSGGEVPDDFGGKNEEKKKFSFSAILDFLRDILMQAWLCLAVVLRPIVGDTIVDAFPFIMGGTLVTVGSVALALGMGLVLGVPMAVLQVYGNALARRLVGLYVWFFRGVPILVLLFLSQGLFLSMGWILEPFLLSCLVMGCISTAYQSQIFRGAIESLPQGQLKAARALGMRDLTAITCIILPQALRLSIPGWANEFSILLKDSAVCYLLGTMEIMARVNAVAQRTHEHLAFFALAGVIYFVLTLIVLKLLRRLENKVQIPGYSAGTVGSMAKNTQHGVKNA